MDDRVDVAAVAHPGAVPVPAGLGEPGRAQHVPGRVVGLGREGVDPVQAEAAVVLGDERVPDDQAARLPHQPPSGVRHERVVAERARLHRPASSLEAVIRHVRAFGPVVRLERAGYALDEIINPRMRER